MVFSCAFDSPALSLSPISSFVVYIVGESFAIQVVKLGFLIVIFCVAANCFKGSAPGRGVPFPAIVCCH